MLVRRALLVVAAVCLSGGPVALAFFSGGFYAQPRLVAALVAWTLVLGLCVAGPAPLPRTGPGRLAVGGLTFLTAWSALSITWAPLGGPAVESLQRVLLYLGTLVVSIGVLRAPWALRATEPALAAGALVVIGYGLAGRLLPGVIELDRSVSAGGRLEQPITYWNAEGALAAVGLILCARLAGDMTRSSWLRCAGAAVAVPLSAGVYLSFSRGALGVGVLGVLLLAALAPTPAQTRASFGALLSGAAAAGIASAFAGVASLEGSLDDRVREGALAGALLVGLALSAAALTGVGLRRERPPPPSEVLEERARRRGALAGGAILLALIALLVGGLGERPTAAELGAGAEPGRLVSASSNRYEYWRVGAAAFRREPVLGLGAGGFRVEWLRERPIAESVQDVHSLVLEMAAELGAIGLLAFALVLGGVGVAARRALATERQAAAGACAAGLAWLLHACIDWDWQLPAVTLPAVVLAAMLVSLSETPRPSDGGRSPDPGVLAPPARARPSSDPRRA